MQKYSASEVWQSSEVLWETFNVNYTKYSWLFNNFFVIFFGGWCLFFFLNVKQSKLSRIGMRRVKKNQERQKPWKILQLNHFHNGFDRAADHSCPLKKTFAWAWIFHDMFCVIMAIYIRFVKWIRNPQNE